MKEIEYGPKVSGYKEKSKLIEKLSNTSDRNVIGVTLVKLGEQLNIDLRLSNKQQACLIEGLEESQLLTYNQSLNQLEEIPTDIDGVLCDVERDGKLQFHTIALLWKLKSIPLEITNKMALLKAIMNRAHACGFNQTSFYVDDEKNERGLNNLNKVESEVFMHRDTASLRLQESGVMSAEDREYIIETEDVESLRKLNGYDELILFNSFSSICKEDGTLACFNELQNILYVGYTMGMRDAIKSYKRK